MYTCTESLVTIRECARRLGRNSGWPQSLDFVRLPSGGPASRASRLITGCSALIALPWSRRLVVFDRLRLDDKRGVGELSVVRQGPCNAPILQIFACTTCKNTHSYKAPEERAVSRCPRSCAWPRHPPKARAATRTLRCAFRALQTPVPCQRERRTRSLSLRCVRPPIWTG